MRRVIFTTSIVADKMLRAAIFVPLLLVGCGEANVAAKPTAEDSCGAVPFQGLVGQTEEVLRPMRLPDGTRVIGPDQSVTMDFRPTRMNIEIGVGGLIARIGCY